MNESGKIGDRATRVRENKRRSRARQKEYIADLEQRLRRVQEHGVQATKEVQLAAQSVLKENIRLRQLLRHQGVDEYTISSWAKGDDYKASNLSTVAEASCPLPQQAICPLPQQAIRPLPRQATCQVWCSLQRSSCAYLPPSHRLQQNHAFSTTSMCQLGNRIWRKSKNHQTLLLLK